MRLGTAVKPLWQDEFDVDLVCFLMHANENMGARYLKKLVGDRLRENGRYAPILQEKQRCWRLNFAGQFHMDITPAVKNPRCKNGGLLVPDKDLDQSMKPSNPEGYAQWFEDRAELAPIRFGDSHVEIRADVEPLPEQVPVKGLLKRIVQICKRHRDIMFKDDKTGNSPISIIITTLAAQSYEEVVRDQPFLGDLEIIHSVISHMDRYIKTSKRDYGFYYDVPNPTTDGENFAEKWNMHPARVTAFQNWHRKIVSDIEELAQADGLDALIEHLKEEIIGPQASRVLSNLTGRVSTARNSGILLATPATGLSTELGRPVHRNNFYGRA